MCLHVNLKFDRVVTRVTTDEDFFKKEEIRIYRCGICGKEFEIVEWL